MTIVFLGKAADAVERGHQATWLGIWHAFVPFSPPALSGALAFTVKILQRPTPEHP